MNIKTVSIDKVKNNNVDSSFLDAPKAKRGRPALPDHLKKNKRKLDENGNPVKRGRPSLPDHLKKNKRKLDENGNPVKRGRPSLPDHLKKQPTKTLKLDVNGNPVKRGRPRLPENLKKQPTKTLKLDVNGNPVKRGRPRLPENMKKQSTKTVKKEGKRSFRGSNKDSTMTTFEMGGFKHENMDVIMDLDLDSRNVDMFDDEDGFDDGIIVLR